MDIYNGYFFIADISGYTMFLTSSELTHAKEILDELFEIMLDNVQQPLKMSKAQGDAIVTYAPAESFLQPQTLHDVAKKLYFDFRRRVELMDINTTCTCTACSNMKRLDMKVFLHYGEYAVQQIDGKDDLLGSDVILSYRLMKNTVKEDLGLNGYGLYTKQAVEAMQLGEKANDMIPHSEEYEHLGKVEMFIHDLNKEWQVVRDKEEIIVDAEEAWIYKSIDLPVSQVVAWDFVTSLDSKRVYLGMESVERDDDGTGYFDVGDKFHCKHSFGDIKYMFTDWHPPHHYSTEGTSFGFKYRLTLCVESIPTGSRFSLAYAVPHEGEYEHMTEGLTEGTQEQLEKVLLMIEEEIKAGRIEMMAAA